MGNFALNGEKNINSSVNIHNGNQNSALRNRLQQARENAASHVFLF